MSGVEDPTTMGRNKIFQPSRLYMTINLHGVHLEKSKGSETGVRKWTWRGGPSWRIGLGGGVGNGIGLSVETCRPT
jgi:hypothetical protein